MLEVGKAVLMFSLQTLAGPQYPLHKESLCVAAVRESFRLFQYWNKISKSFKKNPGAGGGDPQTTELWEVILCRKVGLRSMTLRERRGNRKRLEL